MKTSESDTTDRLRPSGSVRLRPMRTTKKRENEEGEGEIGGKLDGPP
jgi:hypothetical protein